ncbi:MAG: SpaA isopeptide-forming pilin-related protein [Peptostreptococcaceae bacterium]|nr:SpaA isopeptide-forming pilin-related protein [Peptostreptococcaceae bacterium]
MSKKQSKRNRHLLSFLMAAFLVLNIFIPTGAYAAGKDYDHDATKQLMKNVESSLKVQGATNAVVNGEEITADKRIEFGLKFTLPLDDPTVPLIEDTLTFTVAEGFKLDAPKELDIHIEGSDLKIGTLKLFNEGGNIVAKIAFEQSDEVKAVFDKADDIKFEITGWMLYGGHAWDVPAAGKNVDFWGTEFKLMPGVQNNNYSVEKSGKLIDRTTAEPKIEWTVVLSGKDNASKQPISLEAHKFVDDLSNVGKYVDGSLKVNNRAVTPSATAPNLEYTFEQADALDQGQTRSSITVTFQTHVSKEDFFGNKKISNTADLYQGANKVASGEANEANNKAIDLTSQWIKKGGSILSTLMSDGSIKRQAIWTIEINKDKALLNNAAITDVLLDGMLKAKDSDNLMPTDPASKQKFVEAYIEVPNGSEWKKANGTLARSWNAEPAGGKYELPNPLNDHIRLKIITEIAGAPQNVTGSDIATVRYENQASATWDGLNGPIQSNRLYADFKFNSIQESYSKHIYPNGNIEWNITVEERTKEIPDLQFFNMVTFGDTPLDVTKLTVESGKTLPAGFLEGYGKGNEKLQGLGQRFIKDTFQRTTPGNSNVLRDDIIDLYQDGKVVGQLLVVKGITGTNRETFKIQTEIVSKKLQDKNDSSSNDADKITNSSTLYSGNTKLDSATAKADRKNGLLHKQFLKRGASANLEKNVTMASGMVTEAKDQAFDYDKKEIIYRLSINAFGHDWKTRQYFDTDNTLKTHGKVTISDTLPDGWEFKNFDDGKPFKLFKSGMISDGDGNRSVTLTDDSGKGVSKATEVTDPAQQMGLTVNGKAGDKKISFTFDSLDRAAVILVKATPTDAKAKEIFAQNDSTPVTNTVNFKTESGIDQTVKLEDTIKSSVLGKSIKKKANGEYDITDDGALQWKLNYHSYNIKQDPNTKIKVEDQLPDNLKLPVDLEGKLEDGAVIIKERIFENGVYKDGADVTATLKDRIEYNLADNKLIFNVPIEQDGTVKSYSIEYKTYLVKGNAGEKFKNEAGLFSGTSTNVAASAVASIEFVLTDATVKATLGKNATLEILKVDSSDASNKLKGAKFGLFAKIGNNFADNPFEVLSTDANGKIIFTGLPVGEYQLKEVSAPKGFEKIDTALDVKVTRDSNGQGIVEITGPTPITDDIDVKPDSTTKITKVTFPNKRNATYAGSLKVTKILTDIPVDQDKEFEFTMTIIDNGVTSLPESYNYVIYNNNTAGETKSIRSGESFKLKHGEYALIESIPHGVSVAIEENADGYDAKIETKDAADAIKTVSGKKAQLDVKVDAELEMTFSNTKQKTVPPGGGSTPPAPQPGKGKLEISKKVEGANAELDKPFAFQIFFEGTEKYTLSKGKTGSTPIVIEVASGDIFELKHGEIATLHNLPENLKVTVTELAATMAGYTVNTPSIVSTIVKDDVVKAAFTNTKIANAVGNVEIKKLVEGATADLNKDFEFTAVFSDGNKYKAIKTDAKGISTEIDLASNGKFTLKHDEKLTIQNLPKDLEVKITERSYEDYDVTPNIAQSKTIVANTTVYLTFTNTAKPEVGGIGGPPSPPSPVRPPGTIPPTDPPTTIPPNQMPNTQFDPKDPSKQDIEKIDDNTTPKAESKNKPKNIGNAPKTGLQILDTEPQNFLFGAVFLLAIILLRGYASKKRQ